MKARGLEPRAKLLRLEAEPDVTLLAQRFVVVREVVDDREVAAGAEQARGGYDLVLRAARVDEHARHHDEVGAAGELLERVLDRALAQADVG
jgi:hypothetical protein